MMKFKCKIHKNSFSRFVYFKEVINEKIKTFDELFFVLNHYFVESNGLIYLQLF